MGKIKKNVITKGFSGKYNDDLVFRQVDDQTVFARKAENNAEPTERQREVRDRFAEASIYASGAIDNPQTGPDYEQLAKLQGVKSAYIAALTDFLTEPEITSVFTKAYTGAAGSTINMTSRYPYKITGIDVSILNADGSVLEAGAAIQRASKWRYTTTMANVQVQGTKFVLKARDRVGHESVLEKVL